MSSKTTTKRPLPPEVLEQLAHRPERLLDAGRVRARPEQCREPLGHELALAVHAEELARSFWRLLGRVALVDAGRLPEHGRDRPERDAVAVGQAASAEHRRASPNLGEELATSRDLPTPAAPDQRHELGFGPSARPRESLEQRELAPRPTSGESSGASSPAPGVDLEQPQRGHGSRLPLHVSGPTSATTTASRTSRYVASPMRISPGSAAARAARRC